MRGMSERTVQRHSEKGRIYCIARSPTRGRAREASCLPSALTAGARSVHTWTRRSRWPRTSASWLASIRARDAALAADLGALLADHVEVHESHFLEQAVPLPRAGLASLEGQTLGASRLVSRIGQGGMGSVWLAERCDGRFEGRAAVKLLNLALLGRAGEERFRREGNILARLTHPNIAHLVDAGVRRRASRISSSSTWTA